MFCALLRSVTVLPVATKQGISPSQIKRSAKRLWRNIRSFGLMNGDNVAYTFSADELNTYFTTLATNTSLHSISFRPHIQGDSFTFFCVDEMCIEASIGKITSNTTGLDEIYQTSSVFDSACNHALNFLTLSLLPLHFPLS
jgi:hypothetical protein